MQPMVNIAVRAARAAGEVIVRQAGRLDRVQVTTKGRNDFVSDVDREAEAAIVRTLRKAYPDHAIHAEEGGREEAAGGPPEYTWIIDPLDGTTNFLHGFPHYAISIALQHRNRLEAGVIYDPLREELFTAYRGAGAQLDGRRIRVPQRKSIDGALLGTGFPFKNQHLFEPYLGMFERTAQRASDLRRAGSAALDLAYVAAGRLDGFFELGLQPWDIAAGLLLIEEAGGYVGDIFGGHEPLRHGHVLAASPKAFGDLATTVAPFAARLPEAPNAATRHHP